MAIWSGPGGRPYDDVAEAAVILTKADAIVLVALGGNQGSGLAVSTRDESLLQKLPGMLRKMAGQIEADVGTPN